ncbi:unnamed protein product, partial [Laminaria digitata]
AKSEGAHGLVRLLDRYRTPPGWVEVLNMQSSRVVPSPTRTVLKPGLALHRFIPILAAREAPPLRRHHCTTVLRVYIGRSRRCEYGELHRNPAVKGGGYLWCRRVAHGHRRVRVPEVVYR